MNKSDNSDAFSDAARTFLNHYAPSERMRQANQNPDAVDSSIWRAIAEAGWPAIMVPEDRGGLGLGLGELLAVVEEIGRQPMPEPFVAGAVFPTALLGGLPESELASTLLNQILAGDLVCGVAWQERSGQLDPEESNFHVTHSTAGSFLTGRKIAVMPAYAQGWIVLASGPSAWWIDANTPGLTCVRTEHIDGSVLAELNFDQVAVSEREHLAQGAMLLDTFARAADLARIAQSAELLGISRKAFEITSDYLKTRVQFGKPIGSNQALQHRMVDAWIDLELTAACIADVANQVDAGRQTLSALASRAKARSSLTALHVTRLSVQLHGAIGFTEECDVGIYWKRALHLTGWLGNAEPHCARFGRASNATSPAESNTDDHLAVCTGAAKQTPASSRTDWRALPEKEFRGQLRKFLSANYPKEHRHTTRRLRWVEAKDWYLKLSEHGLIAPAWPKSHGGTELAPEQLLAMIDEFEEFGAARLPDQGVINLGPVLIRYGTREQQEEWLPKIISGENVWCQGYSEPDAGSDLASLRTEAVVVEDNFVINGQKTWTTLAQDATHIFLLVRMDKAAKKQAGISFILADLSSPGITVRPIRNLAGEDEFCEVFLDNVKVPLRNLVGSLNQGWEIAKSLLGHERLFVGSPKTCQHALTLLRDLGTTKDLFNREIFVRDYDRLALDLADLKSVYKLFADIVKSGAQLPPSVSLLKIFASETYQRISSKIVEWAQEEGANAKLVASLGFAPLAPTLTATITSIYGGTNEIQRNILAKLVLELPS